jgi:hypothetical protein
MPGLHDRRPIVISLVEIAGSFIVQSPCDGAGAIERRTRRLDYYAHPLAQKCLELR